MDAFDMFRLLLDEYSSQIIELTQPRALNAVDLSGMLGIPIAACGMGLPTRSIAQITTCTRIGSWWASLKRCSCVES